MRAYERSLIPITQSRCPTQIVLARVCLKECEQGDFNMLVERRQILWSDNLHCPTIFKMFNELRYIDDDTVQLTQTTSAFGNLLWDAHSNMYQMDEFPTKRWFEINPIN